MVAPRSGHPLGSTRMLISGAALALLAGCNNPQPLDFDLRGLGGGFSTAEAAVNAPSRPSPDDRGVIAYPNYQVVVAQRDDTPRTIAARLGLNADALAAHNGIAPDTPLRRDEVLALPTRVSEPVAAAAAGSVDVAGLAGQALDRAGAVTTNALPPAAAAAAAASPATPTLVFQQGPEPIQHQVQRGESAYSIARLYNMPVRVIADWNGLGPDLAVREGQQLLIPPAGSGPAPAAATATTAPGEGSATPVPPSATTALPDDEAPAAAAVATTPAPVVPDLGAQQTTAPATAAMLRPVAGSVIRDYAPGRNEGIDIAAAAGTPVKAAAAGTVAAITTNTQGIQIVVIRHADGLLTVYTHLDNLTVAKDDRVSAGQTIGQVRAGDPSFLHFEVRRGMQSTDPTEFLP